jgi:drug/metabolite transporter (DMT)-like permease
MRFLFILGGLCMLLGIVFFLAGKGNQSKSSESLPYAIGFCVAGGILMAISDSKDGDSEDES